MSDQDIDQSRERRFSRIIKATVTTPGGHQHELLIRNVSKRGLAARNPGNAVRIGDHVTLDLPNIGRITGTVRWSRNGALGIQASGDIDTEALLFRGDVQDIALKPGHYRAPRSFEPETDTRRPGFGRWRNKG